MGAAKKKLAGFVHVNGTVYGPDSDVPAEVAKEITNPKAWVGDDVDGSGEGSGKGEPKGYSDQKPEELQAEADKRGLTVTGTGKDGNVLKGDLVAALEAHDAASGA